MSNVIAFDKRARHRVVSEPSSLDLANDADAQARAHFLALATGNQQLVRELTVAGARVVDVRRLIHTGLDLLHESLEIDPYQLSGPGAA